MNWVKLSFVLSLLSIYQGYVCQNNDDENNFVPDFLNDVIPNVADDNNNNDNNNNDDDPSIAQEFIPDGVDIDIDTDDDNNNGGYITIGIQFQNINQKFDAAQEQVQKILEEAGVDKGTKDNISDTLEKLQRDVNDVLEESLDTFEAKLESEIEFRAFYELLQLTNLLTELNFDGIEHTVFVPSKEAIESATSGQDLSQEELTKILKYHIVHGQKLSSDDLKDGQKLPTEIEGQSLTVKVTAKKDDDDDDDDDDDEIYDEFDDKTITIVGANNQANLYDESEDSDMVYIHLIDTLLLPP